MQYSAIELVMQISYMQDNVKRKLVFPTPTEGSKIGN